jgi:hypothetical protein
LIRRSIQPSKPSPLTIYQSVRAPGLLRVGRGGLVDVRVGAGADQRVHLNTLAADLPCEIAEDAEAGDHRQHIASRHPDR